RVGFGQHASGQRERCCRPLRPVVSSESEATYRSAASAKRSGTDLCRDGRDQHRASRPATRLARLLVVVLVVIHNVSRSHLRTGCCAQSLKMFRRAGGFRESTGIELARIGMGNLMVLSEWRRKMVRR